MSVETMTSPTTGRVTGYRATVRQYGKKVHSRVFSLKSEARREEAIMKAEIAKGRNIQPQYETLPLKQAFERWFEEQVKVNGGYKYQKQVRGIFLRHLFPFFGSRDLRTIKADDVFAFRECLLKKGLSKVTINSILKKLKAIANHHIEEERLVFNPVKRKHMLGGHEREHVVWSRDECRRFLEYADRKYSEDHREVYLIYKIAANCGMRWGEIAALHVDDLDFANSKIWVRKSYCQAAKCIKLPKSGRTRFATLPPDLARELSQYVEKHNVSGILFKNEKGGYYSHNTLRNCHWQKDVAAAGVPATKFHNLRRFYQVEFLANGGNEVMLRKLVGHRDSRMTDLYVTMREDFKDVASIVNL